MLAKIIKGQKMERINFTQSRVRGLDAPEPKNGKPTRKTYYDNKTDKLTVRVASSGSKVFYVITKDQFNKTKFVKLGKFPAMSVDEAREAATTALSTMNRGIDPNEEKRKAKAESQTLQQLLDSYISDHTLKPLTMRDYRQKMNWGFSDWLDKPASKITDNMVLARHKKLSEKGKTATNGAFRPLRAVLNYAITLKAIKHNPVAVLSAARLWHKEKRKSDLIESSQLSEWVRAVELLSPTMHRTAFLMMLYMGFRITETYSIRWTDVDLDSELIVQRDTKNGTDHELPIPTVLVSLIHELKAETGNSGFMFPAQKRDSFHGRPKRQIKQINDAVSFDFNPHMARHTFTTIAEAVGISKTMIDRLTNHTTTNDVTGGYIHTETETLRDAINKIAAYIQTHTAPPTEKVVQLYG